MLFSKPVSKMSEINLAYGKTFININFDSAKFDVLGEARAEPALTDAEIGAKFDNPIDSPTIEEIVGSGESVLIVVPDATRQTASGQIVNLLVRRLIANGTMPFDIRIIFATGIHRRVTEAEQQMLLTPFIARRIKILHHNPRDLAQIVRLGETSNNIPIELNRALTEHDHVIVVGGISFHYFAGFTGGRKLICPGLASARTISATHKLAFDCETKQTRNGVGTGILEGNAVHEAFMEVVKQLPPSFSISTIVNEHGAAADIFCGDWISAHRTACDFYAARHTVEIAEKRDVVVVSCGGFPHDINLIQAHKALDAASNACADGGTIVLLAECPDGLGKKDFLSWFKAKNADDLAENLCAGYQVNGQTAWNLLRKTQKFNVKIITNLSEEEMRAMNFHKLNSLDKILSEIDNNTKGYIMPFGAKYLIEKL